MDSRHEQPADVPLVGLQAFELDADFSALGIALRDILLLRRSQQEFAQEPVPQYRLSRLLWAACGRNRDGALQRTTPSVCGGLAIDLYVSMASGLYRFDAVRMALASCGGAGLRARDLPGASAAPLELVYAANLTRMAGVPEPDRLWRAALDAGFMAQNVSLFCAAEGLATCVQVPPDCAGLAREMGLAEGECVLLRQSVGLPLDAPPRNPWM